MKYRFIAVLVFLIAVFLAKSALAQNSFSSPPSILPQCLDSKQVGKFVGPSARARECTRQYCAMPEYQEKVKAYAFSKAQSDKDAKEALICITRFERDSGS